MFSTLFILLISCSGGSDNNVVDSNATTQEQVMGQQAFNDQKNIAAVENDQTASAIAYKPEQKITPDNNSANTNNSLDQQSDYYSDEDSYYASDDGYTDSSYDQYDANYDGIDATYNQYDSSYGNTDSDYDQYESSSPNTENNSASGNSGYGKNLNNGSLGGIQAQVNSADNDSQAADGQDNSATEANDTNATSPENVAGVKYQRVYDNGIIWYGNLGTLTVQYQSSHSETTGIGFRAHFDNSAMRVTSVTSYPVDAISATSPKSLMSDANNFDNDASTGNYLPFAWASIYGQWPQANQVTLATVEFERLDGGSGNYNVNYSPISVSAGFRFIQ